MPVVGGVFQPIAGLPQWANVRSPQPIGVAGSTGEVDWVAVNGLSGVVASGQFWDQGQAAHTVTGGPTTTSPWQLEVNGVAFFGPFNVAVSLPDFVFQAFVLASQAGWVVT